MKYNFSDSTGLRYLVVFVLSLSINQFVANFAQAQSINKGVFEPTLPIFKDGQSQIVPGFSEALKSMQPGGSYRICLSPKLGYGAEAKGDKIPANSTLLFEVDLLDFKSMAEVQKMQQQMQQQQGAAGGMPGGAMPGGGGLPPQP